MSELVEVRSAKGPRTPYLIPRALFEKYPDDYVLVKHAKKAKPVTPAE